MRLKLIKPTKENESQVMNYKKEFIQNNEKSFDGCAGLEEVDTYDEWLNFEERLSKKYGDLYSPSTVYLAIRKIDNKLVGITDFKHELTPFLFNYGGNIGYSIAPSERRKGYAKEMLGLVLKECKKFKKDKLLLTCDKTNIASVKTIMYNGGILENEIEDTVDLTSSGVLQRYWIHI